MPRAATALASLVRARRERLHLTQQLVALRREGRAPALAAVLGTYAALKLRYRWWHPRRPRR